jgi:glycosyltransferase involved in cell wall biosynthesis
MKIAIVVQGRFHAFDLARALGRRGHAVSVLTNYPRWAVRRFGVETDVRTFPLHGVVTRAYRRTGSLALAQRCDPPAHRWFGRWAARELAGGQWDAIHCWSGVSEELFQSRVAGRALTLLMRGSAHIVVQRRLLDEESQRAGAELDRPSDWMIARECREYALAERIVVLSSFAAATFREQGLSGDRLEVLPLGVDVGAFRPAPEVFAARAARIRGGDPLHVLYVGALSYRKGLLDLIQAARSPAMAACRFTLVGNVMPEVRPLLRELPRNVEIVNRVPQHDLPGIYARADLFLFPTIEDGFPAVLAQAQAAGVPILTTPNGAGHDIVRSARDGWIVPIRDAGAIVERLAWCAGNRTALASMAAAAGDGAVARTWDQAAEEFERACARRPGARRASA